MRLILHAAIIAVLAVAAAGAARAGETAIPKAYVAAFAGWQQQNATATAGAVSLDATGNGALLGVRGGAGFQAGRT